MIRTTLTASALALAAAGAAHADAHGGISGYALADDGSTLVVMADIAAPGEVQTYDLDTPLRAIAYRPVTGDLLGFASGAVYTIDPMSGATTDLGASFMEDAMIAEGAVVALDFNNAIDAVRAVSSEGDNLVYFPEGFGDGDERAGSVRRFTGLAYAEGDENAGAEPMIFANAYTNAINGMTAESTFQYALDAETDALVSLANNDGTLETIAPVTVGGEPIDLAATGGMDIVSPSEGTDMAFAILQAEGVADAGLFMLNLETGEATPLAGLGMGGISGFAASRGM